SEGGEFSQEDLDKVFQKPSLPKGPENLDKGLSYKSYDTVSREVRNWSEPFTAEQMAEKLGMARVTIRRYLDFMVREGKLEVDLEYGKIGRPQHFYRYRKGQ
ncbi:MAG: response regulator, partial [Spirochaetales bacterium]|nr:response regulator [Spirochaetales bacterium]